MIITEKLTKNYKSKIALNNLSLKIEPNSIFGILGPNGAGKTTFIKILLQILNPTSGNIIYPEQFSNNNFQNLIGYIPEERGLYKSARVLDLLIYLGRLKGLSFTAAKESSQNWLTRFGINEYSNKNVETLSKGNQQIIQFISAIIHDPDFLILDEPFSGFDPINQKEFLEIVKDFSKREKYVLVSTHQLDLADKICDSVLFINNGQNIFSGKLNELKSNYIKNEYLVKINGDKSLLNELDIKDILELGNNEFRIMLNESDTSDSFINSVPEKLGLCEIKSYQPNLSEIFFELIK